MVILPKALRVNFVSEICRFRSIFRDLLDASLGAATVDRAAENDAKALEKVEKALGSGWAKTWAVGRKKGLVKSRGVPLYVLNYSQAGSVAQNLSGSQSVLRLVAAGGACRKTEKHRAASTGSAARPTGRFQKRWC